MNAAAAALVVLNGRQAFDPRASLFAHNEPGFWYDPSDLSSMYQDSAGTTPVTAVEQAVGLILDKSRGATLGSELVTNGNFSNGTTGWTITGAWAESGGQFVKTGGSTATASQAILTVGKTYRITIDVVALSSAMLLFVGLGNSQTISTTGTKTFTAACLTDTNLYLQCVSTATATIDNISVREIAGTHAIQPTAASRPVLRNRYNLLERSQEFDNAYWTKTNASISANATTAPDGTLTADKLIDTVTNAEHYAERAYATAGGSHTFRAFLKAAERTWGILRGVNSSSQNMRAWFDLANGVVGTVSVPGGGSASMTSVGNGWYLCQLVVNSASTSAFEWRINVANADNANAYAGDGTSGIFVWGADLRPANDTIYPYQRINAATDYDSDTSKFPLYLAFDGSDDSLYTGGNVDFSATDKMTVWAGVTKLSDAATGIVVELSSDLGANNGAFTATAPLNNSGNTFSFASKGTAFSGHSSATTFAAPSTVVFTGLGDIGADQQILRLNGAQTASSSADQGTGNFGSYPLYIGRRNNATLPFNGRIYQLIVRGAASSAAEIASTERYIAGKQGRAL